jgi:excisionase family DNA binding protein
MLPFLVDLEAPLIVVDHGSEPEPALAKVPQPAVPKPQVAAKQDSPTAISPPGGARKQFQPASPAGIKATSRKVQPVSDRMDVLAVSPNLIAVIEGKSGAWSAPELAKLLGCTGKHIYALAKSGRLPHLRIGTMIRFDPAATAEWLKKRFIAA